MIKGMQSIKPHSRKDRKVIARSQLNQREKNAVGMLNKND